MQHDLTLADVRRSLSFDDRGYLSGSRLSPTSAGKPGVERDQPSDLVQPEDGRVVRFSQMQCGLTDVDVDVSRSVLCDVDVDVVGVQRINAINDQSMYHGTSQHQRSAIPTHSRTHPAYTVDEHRDVYEQTRSTSNNVECATGDHRHHTTPPVVDDDVHTQRLLTTTRL